MDKNFAYKTFLKEITLKMHQDDLDDNHKLAKAMEKQAFELNIEPNVAVALVNYFWDGYIFGFEKACYLQGENYEV